MEILNFRCTSLHENKFERDRLFPEISSLGPATLAINPNRMETGAVLYLRFNSTAKYVYAFKSCYQLDY